MFTNEYPIRRFARRCAVSERPIRGGETYYSVLDESGSDITRRDIAADSWTGPPDNTLAWWRGSVPPVGGAEAAPNEVLLKLVRDWEVDASKVELRHLLALLLQRRRVLRPAPNLTLFGGPADDPGLASLRFTAVGGGEPITIVDCIPEPDRLTDLQRQLAEIVYGHPAAETDASVGTDSDNKAAA